MPAAAQQTEVNAEYAERFAALWAGFDTGNANDAEASGKGRELRRMAKTVDLRIIDVIGRAVVMQALDAQLKPERDVTPELSAARQTALEHCALAKEALAKAEHWAEVAKRQEAVIAELRRREETRGGPSPVGGYVGSVFAFAVVMVAAALLFAGAARIAAALFGG